MLRCIDALLAYCWTTIVEKTRMIVDIPGTDKVQIFACDAYLAWNRGPGVRWTTSAGTDPDWTASVRRYRRS